MSQDEVSEQLQTVESDEPVVAPGEKRKIAHMHNADKRAWQRGPISEAEFQPRDRRVACYESTYHIKNPGGFKINEKLYRGRVIVPECVANYLCQMDTEWERAERNLFRNNPTSLQYEVGK